MAFNSTSGRAEYTAVSAQTSFPYLFKIFLETNILVYHTPVGQVPNDILDILTLGTDYTVIITGDTGGSVELLTGSASGDKVTLVRNLEIDRIIEYQTSGDMLAETLNTDQDYQTYLTADQVANAERFISIPVSAQNINTDLPDVAADAYLKWNGAGDALENDNTIPDNVFNSEDSNLEAGSWANENESVPVKEYTKGIPSDRVPTVYSAKHHNNKAGVSATNAQLSEWNSQAEAMTADSYATEPEDVFVKAYSSNGDGTFTPTDTAEYSSLHYSKKSDLNASTELWNPLTKAINLIADLDYTLTADDNKYGRIVITDTGTVLTAPRSIITDNVQKSFIFQNDTLQNLTVKTSAGIGILVLAGSSVSLYCDGTNIIINSQEVGVNQQWVDETANRVAGVTYTNTTGNPIQLYIASTDTATGRLGVVIDVVSTGQSAASGSKEHSLIVPNGSTYSFDATISKWLELK